MGEFTPSRNQFIPAFTEPISHAWNKEIITIFTDLFMVVYQQGTWFDVTHLPTNLTNVDVANAFRKQCPHLKKAYMALAGTDLTTVVVKKQKGQRYNVTSECTALPDYILERDGGVSDVGFSSCAAPTYYLGPSISDIGMECQKLFRAEV